MKTDAPLPEIRFTLKDVLGSLPPELQEELLKLDEVEREFLLNGAPEEKKAYQALAPAEQTKFAWLPPARRAEEVKSVAQGPSRFTRVERPLVVLNPPATGRPEFTSGEAQPRSKARARRLPPIDKMTLMFRGGVLKG